MIPTATTPRFDKPMRVETDKAALMFDPHAPFHDAAWMNTVIGVALKRGHKHVIIGGDLADFNAFNYYGRQMGIDAEAEIEALGLLMDRLCACFEGVHYFAGNHEVRPLRALKDAGLNVKNIMRMFTAGDGCELSDYHWCELISGGHKFYIEHPKNTSVIPGRVPMALAAKFRCHVIAGHGHVWAHTRDVSGKYHAIDSGICGDPLRLAYYQMKHNTRPAMCQGAVLVEEGVPLLLSPENIGVYA